MPEVIITYKNAKTLQFLKDFSKYFDFSISTPEKEVVNKNEEEFFFANGVKNKKRR